MPQKVLWLKDFHNKLFLYFPHVPGGAKKVSFVRHFAERRLLLFPVSNIICSDIAAALTTTHATELQPVGKHKKHQVEHSS